MTYSIALAGKGGTGKTTMAGLIVKYLVEKGKRPILAVDADPNTNFNEVLGLEVEETLGEAREDMKRGVSPGMTKDIFMEMRLQEAIVESEGFDLVAMGRPEGPGCYCAANTLLTQYLDRLIGNYKYMVVDNEAGMEHISRLTTKNVDLFLVISDPTRRGIQAAARIVELTQSLCINVARKVLIVNQVREQEKQPLEETARQFHLELAGIVPEDPNIRKFDLNGRPTIELDLQSAAVRAAFGIFEKILSN
jgi:CO dehydrogenase maturation factor